MAFVKWPINASFEKSAGIPISELLGCRLNEVPTVTIDPKSGLKTLAAVKAQLPYDDLRHRVTRLNGSVIHVGTSGIPMFDEDKRFIGYCGVSKDISAQVEAERALRRSEARFRELYEIAADHYWECDVQQRITYVSSNYEAVTGISAPRPTQGMLPRTTQLCDRRRDGRARSGSPSSASRVTTRDPDMQPCQGLSVFLHGATQRRRALPVRLSGERSTRSALPPPDTAIVPRHRLPRLPT
jgi:PAS domain S-box-containing protein